MLPDCPKPITGCLLTSDKGVPIIPDNLMTFDQLIRYFGTQKAAGAALGELGEGGGEGLSQGSVAEWKEKGVPPPRQAQYELITRGKLKADRPNGRRAA